jgi:hypothetical protein
MHSLLALVLFDGPSELSLIPVHVKPRPLRDAIVVLERHHWYLSWHALIAWRTLPVRRPPASAENTVVLIP